MKRITKNDILQEKRMIEAEENFYRSQKTDGLEGIPNVNLKLKEGYTVVEEENTGVYHFIGKHLLTSKRKTYTITKVDGDVVEITDKEGEKKILSYEKLNGTCFSGSLYSSERTQDNFIDYAYIIKPEGFKTANYTTIDGKFAENAFRGTSFHSEARSDQYRKEWEHDVNRMAIVLDAVADTPEQRATAISLQDTFFEKSLMKFTDFLSAHSRCISVMITGASRFPQKKAAKANEATDKRSNDYINYVKRAFEKYPKIVRETLTKEEIERGMTNERKEFWFKLKKDIALCEEIAKKGKGEVPSYIKKNLNSSLVSRLETLWRNRDYETFNMALDMIKSSGKVFSKTNAIWERHKNTPTDELYQSPEMKNALALVVALPKIDREKYEEKKKDYQWNLEYDLSHLSSQNRDRSLKIVLREIKKAQAEHDIELLPEDSYYWKNLQDEDMEEVKPIDKEEAKTGTIYSAEGCEVVDNTEIERVQILFPSKPDREIIGYLKKNGFNWSPYYSAWQRKNTPNGIKEAIKFAKEFFPAETEKSSEEIEAKEEQTEDDLQLRIRISKAKAKAMLMLHKHKSNN